MVEFGRKVGKSGFPSYRLPLIRTEESDVFQGTSLLTLDSRGRIGIPARHREAFKVSDVTLTRHPDGCVLLYPRALWEEKRAALTALPYASRVFQRIVLGSAVDLQIDAVGRILIPSELRTLCALTRKVALVGLGDRLEIWDSTRLLEQEKSGLEKGFGEAAESFRF